tara:strand:- start:331 stop:903 length:573 start_codon:yes stop_codon:yes gene_type:complete
MVKIGFICEGKTERKLIESAVFQNYLLSIGIECVKPVIDADGNGNLLPNNIENHVIRLKHKGAERIVILTDLDEDVCVTRTKNRIIANEDDFMIVVVAVKQIESWFLADSKTMSLLLKRDFEYDFPETVHSPFDTIKQIFLDKLNRGAGNKILLASKMISNGFSVERAAIHSNCPSAVYFLKKLKQIATS